MVLNPWERSGPVTAEGCVGEADHGGCLVGVGGGAVVVRSAAAGEIEHEHGRAALVAGEAVGEALGRSAVTAGDGSAVRLHHDQGRVVGWSPP